MAVNNAKGATAFNNIRIADTRTGAGGSNPLAAVMPNFADINAMRTYLQTQAASTYTNDRLNQMTVNDMVYAIRVIAGGATQAGVR